MDTNADKLGLEGWGGGISKVFDWTDKQHIYTVFIRERNTTHMYIITRERETVHMYIITRERETVHMYVITRERDSTHVHLCVHQPNDAKRYDYHLVYTSFPLAFSYVFINSHRHWGCSSVHVL